jgi:L-threonate 2-dehydrogenase
MHAARPTDRAENERPAAPVGVIGLGSMGLPLARNLIADGHDVVGYRRTPGDELAAIGGTRAESVRAVAERCDVIFTCLPSSDALLEVVSGPNGIVAAGRAGIVVIEISTLPLADKEAARAAIEAAGGAMLDAPVSGTPPMLAGRQTVAFVSGAAADYERALPALAAIGAKTPLVGPFGNGMKLKLVANLLLAAHIATAAEAIAYSEASGLDSQLVVEALGGSAAGSTMFAIRGPMMAGRAFPQPPGSTIDMLRKDLGIIADHGRAIGATTAVLETVSGLFDRAAADGHGPEDPATLLLTLTRRPA